MIKLYGHPASTCTRKVLMTLAETSTHHEFQNVDFMKGEHKAPDHVARQPFGQMPAIDDDGFMLYESRAIMRYIAQKANSSLLPTELQARARVEQWVSVESFNFYGHSMKFVYEHAFKRPQGEAVMTAAAESLGKTLAVMATQLEQTPYIAGADFTVADIGFMPYIEYTIGSPAQALYEQHPAVMAWWKRISERPTWKKIAGR